MVSMGSRLKRVSRCPSHNLLNNSRTWEIDDSIKSADSLGGDQSCSPKTLQGH